MLKRLLTSGSIIAAMASPALADEVKMGILLGFTGPAESVAPNNALAAELAWSEVNDSGLLLDGATIVPVRADSTCADASTAVTAAERLATSESVMGIVGPNCSGITVAVTRGVTAPLGVTLISPSATSPSITDLDDRDFTYRTVPSDARQGVVLAEAVLEAGINTVAVSYVNDDYGKGLSSSFESAYTEKGGKILLNASHEDGRGDYSAEVGALAAVGADTLVVLGRFDQGGRGVIQGSLDAGAFESFVLADGMISQTLVDNLGDGIEGAFGTQPGSSSDAAKTFVAMAADAGFDGDGLFRAESYDAAAVLALALQSAGVANRDAVNAEIRNVSNAPGEKIYPGELAKALQILKDGGEIDYEGATGVTFDANGEVPGSYRIEKVVGGKFELQKVK